MYLAGFIIKKIVRFSKKKLNTKYVFWLSLQDLFEIFLILRRNERGMVISVFWSLCIVLVVQIRFDWNLNFLDKSSKKYSNRKFLENPPPGGGGELFYMDRRTDIKKLIVELRNFMNSPKTLLPNHWVYFCVVCGSQKTSGVFLTLASLIGFFFIVSLCILIHWILHTN